MSRDDGGWVKEPDAWIKEQMARARLAMRVDAARAGLGAAMVFAGGVIILSLPTVVGIAIARLVGLL